MNHVSTYFLYEKRKELILIMRKIYIAIFILIANSTTFAFDKRPAIELLVWIAQADPMQNANLAIDKGIVD